MIRRALTWADVKKAVEHAGVQDTDEIGYIDVTRGEIIVEREQDADGVWRVVIE